MTTAVLDRILEERSRLLRKVFVDLSNVICDTEGTVMFHSERGLDGDYTELYWRTSGNSQDSTFGGEVDVRVRKTDGDNPKSQLTIDVYHMKKIRADAHGMITGYFPEEILKALEVHRRIENYLTEHGRKVAEMDYNIKYNLAVEQNESELQNPDQLSLV
ncbi:hypothetical protein J4466_04075 [Candidatus Pacearchaeota archaeon]|nr:hypothetical protein [Candidatus Pacearchaeota archaeon]